MLLFLRTERARKHARNRIGTPKTSRKAMVEIEISGPGKNALGTQLMAQLTERIDEANGAPLLFTGAGDAFSAGLNLKEVASLDAEGMTAVLDRLVAFFRRVWLYPGPTVAAVNGHAIAGGCILAMCCDRSIATANPKARIGLNEVALGLRFPPALLRFVKASVSPQNLTEVTLGARLYAPQEAAALGLIHAVSDDPKTDAAATLATLARHPVDAYAAAKKDLRGGIMDATAAEEEAFRAEVVPYWTSPELKAMIASLLGG